MRLPYTLYIWGAALRIPYFIISIIPPILAFCLFLKENGAFTPKTGVAFSLLLAGTVCMHGATNLFNDYYDTINGVDNKNSVGGSRVVLNGLLSLTELKFAGLLCYALSFLMFMALAIATQRFWIVPGWLFGAAASFFYVGPPLAYGYRGWGEVGVFVSMGWLLLFGSHLALSGRFSWSAFWLANIVGLMSAEVLFFQSLPQIETDPLHGKYTLASRLGCRHSARIQTLVWPLTWIACIILALTGTINQGALLCLFGIPLYVKSQSHLDKWSGASSPQQLYDSGSLVRGMFFITSISLFISIL